MTEGATKQPEALIMYNAKESGGDILNGLVLVVIGAIIALLFIPSYS